MTLSVFFRKARHVYSLGREQTIGATGVDKRTDLRCNSIVVLWFEIVFNGGFDEQRLLAIHSRVRQNTLLPFQLQEADLAKKSS